MDFLDPTKKRAHRIRLTIGYVLMAILLSFATLILVFQAYGYDYDRKSRSVIQNGLIFLDSQPESAEILVNGENRGRTAERLALPEGAYDIELSRPGYRPWRRSINLEGGGIERLVYPLLFPDKLEPAEVDLLPAKPSLVSQSPDQRWLLTQEPTASSAFKIYDLKAGSILSQPLLIPDNLFSVSSRGHRCKVVAWADDNRHILIEHQFNDDSHEFLVLDRENPTASLNLNRLLASAVLNIDLRDEKADEFYAYNPVDRSLSTASISQPVLNKVADKVLAYKSYGPGEIIYVADDGAVAGKVRVMIRSGGANYVLRELPTGGNYLVDLSRFDGSWYFAVGAANENKAYVYRNPVATLKRNSAKPAPIAVLSVTNPLSMKFSPVGRFIALVGGQAFSVRDLDAQDQFAFTITSPLDKASVAEWMDGYRLKSVSDSKLVVFDFDGTNLQTLTPSEAGSMSFFDDKYDNLFTFSPAPRVPGRFSLTRTSLRANQ